VVSGIPLADARGSEALKLSRGRQGVVVNNYGGQDTAVPDHSQDVLFARVARQE
jgi:hypothetical protein